MVCFVEIENEHDFFVSTTTRERIPQPHRCTHDRPGRRLRLHSPFTVVETERGPRKKIKTHDSKQESAINIILHLGVYQPPSNLHLSCPYVFSYYTVLERPARRLSREFIRSISNRAPSPDLLPPTCFTSSANCSRHLGWHCCGFGGAASTLY